MAEYYFVKGLTPRKGVLKKVSFIGVKLDSIDALRIQKGQQP